MIEKIPISSYKNRIEKVQNKLSNTNVQGLWVGQPTNIFYLTGFFHTPTERPVVLFIPVTGNPVLYVPFMEFEEAKRIGTVEDVRHYFEYPGKTHPLVWMAEDIQQTYRGLNHLLIDGTGLMLDILAETHSPVDLQSTSLVTEMRLLKDEEEIELLTHAAKYGDAIVHHGMKVASEGIAEIDLLQKMTNEILKQMLNELNEIIYVPGGPSGGLVPSGPRTGMPHALPSTRKLKVGDTLILSCGANVGGYRVECERTTFLGECGTKQKNAFQVMERAQKLAIELMRPGKSCSEIDRTVLGFIKEQGYGGCIKHRTGHGKGLEEHEPPWVEEGDPTILKPGMVLSSEPGIYIEGFSGFRHSDTVVVTEGAPLVLTKFPTSLDQLIIPL